MKYLTKYANRGWRARQRFIGNLSSTQDAHRAPALHTWVVFRRGGSQEKKKTRAGMQAHGRQYRPVGPAKFAIRDPMHRVGVALPPFISRPACARVYQGLSVCQSLSHTHSLSLSVSLLARPPRPSPDSGRDGEGSLANLTTCCHASPPPARAHAHAHQVRDRCPNLVYVNERRAGFSGLFVVRVRPSPEEKGMGRGSGRGHVSCRHSCM